MKGTLSLVISIMVAALAVAVPAYADPGLNGAPEMSSAPTSDWFERAAAAAGRQGTVAPYVDAFERPGMAALRTSAPDWFERAAAADARGISAAPYVDAFERPAPVSISQTASSPLDTGTDIAWGQIGVAFGIGLVLALGLILAVRSRPSREVA